MGRTIRIKLKDELSKKISTEIKGLVNKYSLNNDKYWDSVRRIAINYWLSLDRHEIFYLSSEIH